MLLGYTSDIQECLVIYQGLSARLIPGGYYNIGPHRSPWRRSRGDGSSLGNFQCKAWSVNLPWAHALHLPVCSASRVKGSRHKGGQRSRFITKVGVSSPRSVVSSPRWVISSPRYDTVTTQKVFHTIPRGLQRSPNCCIAHRDCDQQR